MVFNLILMFWKYTIFSQYSLLLVILSWVLSPILALPLFVGKEDWKGQQREFLIKELRYFQTYDNPVDEWWLHRKYMQGLWGEKYTRQDFQNSEWLRYRARIEWLIRNPASGFFEHLFGYSKAGMKTVFRKNCGTWDSGKSNYEVWVVENDLGQYAFNLKFQWFFYGRHFVRCWVGWKLVRANRSEAEPNIMLALHLNPFRTWKERKALKYKRKLQAGSQVSVHNEKIGCGPVFMHKGIGRFSDDFKSEFFPHLYGGGVG